jgi:hypothetical protein
VCIAVLIIFIKHWKIAKAEQEHVEHLSVNPNKVEQNYVNQPVAAPTHHYVQPQAQQFPNQNPGQVYNAPMQGYQGYQGYQHTA